MKRRVLKTEMCYTFVSLLKTYYNEEEFVFSVISVPERNIYLNF